MQMTCDYQFHIVRAPGQGALGHGNIGWLCNRIREPSNKSCSNCWPTNRGQRTMLGIFKNYKFLHRSGIVGVVCYSAVECTPMASSFASAHASNYGIKLKKWREKKCDLDKPCFQLFFSRMYFLLSSHLTLAYLSLSGSLCLLSVYFSILLQQPTERL